MLNRCYLSYCVHFIVSNGDTVTAAKTAQLFVEGTRKRTVSPEIDETTASDHLLELSRVYGIVRHGSVVQCQRLAELETAFTSNLQLSPH
jgi:hypothetical protein